MLSQWRRAVEDGVLDARCRMLQRTTIDRVVLPLDRAISPALRRIILRREYERNEIDIVRKTLDPEDKVLECGAGLGLLATYCALRIGSDRVKTFEANPFMLPLISKTFTLNHVAPALVIGAIGPKHGQIGLHVRENFWASSSHHRRLPGSLRTIGVLMHALHDEILDNRPTYLVLDIEGAEHTLVGSSELPGVRKVMIELHPELIGDDGVHAVLGWLSDLGFRKDREISKELEMFLARH
jgi:FkbM family methyltransferase